MPQLQFPFFPEGITRINADLAFVKKDGQVTYYNGAGPIAQHKVQDQLTFRSVIGQICTLGLAQQSEMARVFGIPKIRVLRAVKLFRESGVAGFTGPRTRRGPAVLIPSVKAEAQALLDQRLEIGEVAGRLGLKANTLAKAVRDGRLHKPAPAAPQTARSDTSTVASSKSQRSCEDTAAPMGKGATNTFERVAASLGQLSSASVQFQAALDIPNGGVLLALPALLALGLLQHTSKHFKVPKGYYGLASIFLLLAFMALARLKSVEALRYSAPGEWGKLLGLDRVPEARTLRVKLEHLSKEGQPAEWSAEMCKDWMRSFPEQATAFYVDGHVRVYNGEQTKLPRRYVSRQKLCLRATTDYWVNAMDGQPFFVVYQDADPGLIKVLVDELVPRLMKDAPNQPTKEELEKDPYLHRFRLIFDRAGYSPELMKGLKEKRIACLTYRKCPGADWRETEFESHKVRLVSGNVVTMRLAERGTLLGTTKSDQIWVREIRRLMPNGHQTSIVATDYKSDLTRVAAAMFARWCQENFFKYMQENYGIDRLVTYETENLPDSTQVINPEHKRLDGEVKRTAALLARKTAEFNALEVLEEPSDPETIEQQIQKKAELHTEIAALQDQLPRLKAQRKATPRHVTMGELPEGERFKGLSVGTKQLLDTIKMAAYRAETAMAQVLRDEMSRSDDARTFLRAIYASEVDLCPDYSNRTLLVRVHPQANRSADAALSHLCREMTETETKFPGTDLTLIYELVTEVQNRPQPAHEIT